MIKRHYLKEIFKNFFKESVACCSTKEEKEHLFWNTMLACPPLSRE